MKKSNISTIGYAASLAAAALSLTGCYFDINSGNGGDDVDFQKGFVVNGVKWAARNVAAQGRFTTGEEDYGMYVDFEMAQDVCPRGWRTPTRNEWAELLSLDNRWITENGIKGREFRLGNKALFLPAAGSVQDGVLNYAGVYGNYWSGTVSPREIHKDGHIYVGDHAYSLDFDRLHSDIEQGALYRNGFSVRCVTDKY